MARVIASAAVVVSINATRPRPLTEASDHVGCAQRKKAHTAFPGQSSRSLRGAEVQQSEWALTRTSPRPRMASADGRVVGIGQLLELSVTMSPKAKFGLKASATPTVSLSFDGRVRPWTTALVTNSLTTRTT